MTAGQNYSCAAEDQMRLYGPQDLEYLSSGHLRKEFTDP